MKKQKRQDTDDGIDDESKFEDEEFIFERRHKKHDDRPSLRQPRESYGRDPERHGHGNSRRRDSAGSKIPHAPN